MEISFNTRKLQKLLSAKKEMTKKWGAKKAQKLAQRLMELRAAQTLSDIPTEPPARCHLLKGDRDGQLSVDLEQPFRLIFVPDHAPVPTLQDGGLDWTKVSKIIVIEVIDPH